MRKQMTEKHLEEIKAFIIKQQCKLKNSHMLRTTEADFTSDEIQAYIDDFSQYKNILALIVEMREIKVKLSRLKQLQAENAQLRKQRDDIVNVVEMCPHCDNEIEMAWDVDLYGYKAYCPVCGNRLMLCDECLHNENIKGVDSGYCDYCTETDTCRYNTEHAKNELSEDALCVNGLCCDCAKAGENSICGDYSENEHCPHRTEDGSCWTDPKNEQRTEAE
ncbi:MAG: hypothetical protein WCS30_00160 [Selenomonadaceae bacterium]